MKISEACPTRQSCKGLPGVNGVARKGSQQLKRRPAVLMNGLVDARPEKRLFVPKRDVHNFFPGRCVVAFM